MNKIMYAKNVYGVIEIIKYFELFLRDLITKKIKVNKLEAVSIFFKLTF